MRLSAASARTGLATAIQPSNVSPGAQKVGTICSALDAIYLTGGSSALRPFQRALQAEFAGVPLVEGDLFGSVASGLAYSGG